MSRAGRIIALIFAALLTLTLAQGCSSGDNGTPAAGTPEDPTVVLRDGAVQVAEDTALALVSLDHREPENGYDRLLALLTGPAKQEWEQKRAEYVDTLVSDVVTIEAPVVDASGIAAFDPGAPSAQVLVAAAAEVSSQAAPAEQRRYQLQMSLVQNGDEEWKVSELQFVS